MGEKERGLRHFHPHQVKTIGKPFKKQLLTLPGDSGTGCFPLEKKPGDSSLALMLLQSCNMSVGNGDWGKSGAGRRRKRLGEEIV
jgi:hypothetical protein